MEKTFEVVKVAEANHRARLKPDFRGFIALWRTSRGYERKTGWVAYFKYGSCWAKTKKEALLKARSLDMDTRKLPGLPLI